MEKSDEINNLSKSTEWNENALKKSREKIPISEI